VYCQNLQPIFKASQVVAQPNAANAGGRDEHANLTKLIARPILSVGQFSQAVLKHSLFNVRINPVTQVRLTPTLSQQGLNPVDIKNLFIAVKRIS